jgi:hypothetical protein
MTAFIGRREFITLLSGAAVAWPLGVRAQQAGKLPLVGVLVSASPPHPFADASQTWFAKPWLFRRPKH